METKTVKNLFIAFLLWLPLQYVLAGIFGFYGREQWPAFTFPGFKSVHVYNGLFEVQQTYFEVYNSRGDKAGTYKPYQFFFGLPRSQVAGFMRDHFPDADSVDHLSTETKQWLKDNAAHLTQSEQVASLRMISLVEYRRQTDNGFEIDSTSQPITYVISLVD